MKWSARIIVAAAVVVAAAVLWQTALGPGAGIRRYRAEAMQALRSPGAETRKRAAWAVIERPDPTLEAFMIEGAMGAEPKPDVREAYVYALGKLGNPRNFAAIESAVDSDPSGYVRAAAWLAAARCDPQHFRALAEARARPEQPWDQLGVAQGRLCLGDVGGVSTLLAQALEGNDARRHVASRALFKWLRPLLDAAGRWPVDADVVEGELWSTELVAEVKRRCAELDLQAIADTIRRHQAESARVRGNVRKLTGAREDLVGLLFAQ